jgi:beta-galactosidase
VGNGDPNSHESEKASERSLYNGLAQVIVQSRRAGSGEAEAARPGRRLQPAEITLAVQPMPASPAVAAAEPVTQLLYWRISPAQAQQPDPNVVLADNDMNSWGWGEVPIKQAAEPLAWRLYRTDLRLRADLNDGRARLVFREMAGKAQVWLAGVKLGEKAVEAPAEFSVLLPKGATTRQLTVMVQSDSAQPSGLRGQVVVVKP